MAEQDEFKPSKYQEAVFDWFQHGNGNVGVNAVAGSGKTSTIVEGMKRLPGYLQKDAGFVAFNKDIATELGRRIGSNGNTSVTCQTLHAMGYAALRTGLSDVKKWEVEDRKYRKLVREIRGLGEYGDEQSLKDTVYDLAMKAQVGLTDPTEDDLMKMANEFNIDIPAGSVGLIAEAVSVILEEGIEQTKKGIIAFNDMIYAPVKLQFRPKQFSLLAIDEAQDLNRAQMNLAAGAVAPGGRVVFVGDPRQAIYMFAGALSDSFFRLQKHFGADLLPLSICYRCPEAVIKLAQSIVPEIECAPNAQVGEVRQVSDGKLDEMLNYGDMILCRLTAPLIKKCFELIAQGRSAKVKGRDIGAQLGKLIKQVCHREENMDRFVTNLYCYRDDQIYALRQIEGTEQAQESIRDKTECLFICYTYFRPSTMQGFINSVGGLFDEGNAAIVLSTIHRAKGLENDRVFILKPEKLPLTWKNQSAAQYQQEENLRYVAYTRAKHSLFIVDESMTLSAPGPLLDALIPEMAGSIKESLVA